MNGVLTFKQSPNYEDASGCKQRNEYNVTVVATDSDDEPAMAMDRDRDGDQRGRGGHANAVHAAAS